MKQIWPVTLSFLLLCATACIDTQQPVDTQQPEVFRIQTGEASSVTEVSATVSATVWPTSDMQEVTAGFLCSTDSRPNLENSKKFRIDGWTTGEAYILHLDALTPGTTYYYRAYIQFDGEVHKFGDVKSFTTAGTARVVQTGEAEFVKDVSVRISGTAWPTWEMEDPWVGLRWSADGPPDQGSPFARVHDWQPASVFYHWIEGLIPGTTYYYQAFIVQKSGTRTYGEVRSFTTEDIPVTITLNEASEIHNLSALLSGTLNQGIGGEDIYLKWWPNPQEHIVDYRIYDHDPDGKFERRVRLRPGQTYSFQASAVVKGKTITSEIKTFSTPAYQYVAGEAVDLGLSVLWSSVNLGAANPDDEGAFYSWDSAANHQQSGSDAANVLLGDGWRLPTYEEVRELKNACTWTSEVVRGVPCLRITGKSPGNTDRSILLPATGYHGGTYYYWMEPIYRFNFWTADPSPGRSGEILYAYAFVCYESWAGTYSFSPGLVSSKKTDTMPIRPVKDKTAN